MKNNVKILSIKSNARDLILRLVSSLSLVAGIASAVLVDSANAAVNFEAGSRTVSQANSTTWTSVTFSRTFDAPPVVVMGPATYAGGDPMTMRVRNVTATGFDFQLDEYDYKDGAHTTETIHFFALSEGIHQFGSQRWQVGRVAAVNRTSQVIGLNGFSATPVVLTQIETTNNMTSADGTRCMNARVSDVTAANFTVQLRSEVAQDAVSLADEGVGFIAISEGQGYLDGKVVNVVNTGAVVTHVFGALTFPLMATNPLLVAQAQTQNDAEAGELRVRNLGASGVEMIYQEELSADSNATHAAEEVGYILLSDFAGESEAKIVFGEEPINQTTPSYWQAVTFPQSYATPVVVMGPPNLVNGAAVTVRVRKVTSTGFEFQLDEWDHADGVHTGMQRISYLVMEAGTYAVGGSLWQAGRRNGVTQAGVTTAFGTAFSSAPVVVGQVATTAATVADEDAVTARVHTVTAANFQVETDESEIDTTAHAPEWVHWIAVEQGQSNMFSNGMRFQAGTGGNQTHSLRWHSFTQNHADPYLLAALQTKNDADPATLRFDYLFADKVRLMAQEDGHPAQPGEGVVDNTHGAETVGWLVVQGALDTDGDGAPDAWETSVGLNASNANDGALDPDGDSLTNQQEYHNNQSSPTDFTGGKIVVSRVADAYEVGETPTSAAVAGRFRFSRTEGIAPLTINFSAAGSPAATTRGTASAGDYTLRTSSSPTGGSAVTTAISLNANANSVDVWLHPVQDTQHEYPEGVRATLTGSTQYQINGSGVADCWLYDGQDTLANEKLFVGTFLPEGGASTSASGLATLILNGRNNLARISTTFNNLTTPQTAIDGSHIHFSNGTIVYGDPDGLDSDPSTPEIDIGALVDVPWSIRTSGAFNGQRLVDALFRVAPAEYLYVNVHTNAYSSGEIRAEFTRQQGSSIFVTPPDPGSPENLTSEEAIRRDVARFLTQSTFGPSEQDVTNLYNSIGGTTPGQKGLWANRRAAFVNWMNQQWAMDQTSVYEMLRAANEEEWYWWGQQPNLADGLPPPNNPVDWQRWGGNGYRAVPAGINKESYDPDNRNRRRGWWTIAIQANDQLRQRVAFALEQIFVVSDREGTIANRAYGHARYYDMLADFTDGVRHVQPPDSTYSTVSGNIDVRELLEDISKHPVMGKYLSHLQNQREQTDAQGNVIFSPDENYAREIMQLFSIGLLELHPDGTLKLDAQGKPIPTYTNDDIKELSKVFTGWGMAFTSGSAASGYATQANTTFTNAGGNEYFHPGYENPMKNFATFHDETAKSVLGESLRAINSGEDPAVYAEGDLDRAMNVLYNHPNVGPFLSRLLIQRLVTSNPSRGYVYRVAQVFADHNGAASGGIRGRLRDVVNAILLDYEARSLTLVDPQSVGGSLSVNVSYGKVKEPIIRYAQILRAFDARSRLPLSGMAQSVSYPYPASQLDNFPPGATLLFYPGTNTVLGQTPNNMPSVFNWYLPDYSPGGRVAQAGLVAPELQILVENLVVSNINYHRQVDLTARFDPAVDPFNYTAGQAVDNFLGDPSNALDTVSIDLTQLTDEYKDFREGLGTAVGAEISAATWLVDRLDALLCAGSLKSKYSYSAGAKDPRSVIIDELSRVFVDAPPMTLGNATNRCRRALYLLTVTPEFIVQK